MKGREPLCIFYFFHPFLFSFFISFYLFFLFFFPSLSNNNIFQMFMFIPVSIDATGCTGQSGSTLLVAALQRNEYADADSALVSPGCLFHSPLHHTISVYLYCYIYSIALIPLMK